MVPFEVNGQRGRRGFRAMVLAVAAITMACGTSSAPAQPGSSPSTTTTTTASADPAAERAQCADNEDNDGDTKVDLNDPGCANADDNNEADDPPPPPPPGDIPNQVLALDPHAPGNINLFTSTFSHGAQGLYPSGSPMQPDNGSILSEAQVRSNLTDFLNEQFHNDQSKVNEALALFDSAEVKTVIPNPNLRAAFAGLKGTVLEPTINAFPNEDRFISVGFGALPSAATIANSSGGDTNRVITFNNRYEREDFRHLIPTMGHEILHADGATPNAEEVIVKAFTGMTYLQILLKIPELAHTGTELARQNNTQAMLFLNSRENDSPNSEIFAPSGTGVAPGSPFNQPDLWTIFNGSGSSPGSTALSQILANLGASGSEFSQATAETFENLNDEWMSDKNRVQISVLLQLTTPAEIAQLTGLSEQEVIDALELQPYLDAIR